MKAKRLSEAERLRIALCYGLGMPIAQICEEYGIKPQKARELAVMRGFRRPRIEAPIWRRRYREAVERLDAMMATLEFVKSRPPICLE